MHVLARDDVVSVLYQVLVAVGIRCILRRRSNLVLVLIFGDVLAERLVLARLQHAARPVFLHIEFRILLAWVLARRWIWYLLR